MNTQRKAPTRPLPADLSFILKALHAKFGPRARYVFKPTAQVQ